MIYCSLDKLILILMLILILILTLILILILLDILFTKVDAGNQAALLEPQKAGKVTTVHFIKSHIPELSLCPTIIKSHIPELSLYAQQL